MRYLLNFHTLKASSVGSDHITSSGDGQFKIYAVIMHDEVIPETFHSADPVEISRALSQKKMLAGIKNDITRVLIG